MIGFSLQGRIRHRLRSLGVLFQASLHVTTQRVLGRSLVPDWHWDMEVGMRFWRLQMTHAFALPDVQEAREYIDSLLFDPPTPYHVDIRPGDSGQPAGAWFIPREIRSRSVLLYFHGGGYAFHARSQRTLVAYVAQAAGARTFALDYRLTPEHPHPAQLEDALGAYRWLLDVQGVAPSDIVLAGDSAGGHLVLSTLLALRRAGLPQPALAIGLCPWTDIGPRGASLFANDCHDWIQGDMVLQFGRWLKGDTGASDADLSPIHGDFRGLAPLYLQAGGREILHDMIQEFASIARAQGADVSLDVWDDMPHDFQAFGAYVAHSREALERIGEVVDCHCARTPAGRDARTGVARPAGTIGPRPHARGLA